MHNLVAQSIVWCKHKRWGDTDAEEEYCLSKTQDYTAERLHKIGACLLTYAEQEIGESGDDANLKRAIVDIIQHDSLYVDKAKVLLTHTRA